MRGVLSRRRGEELAPYALGRGAWQPLRTFLCTLVLVNCVEHPPAHPEAASPLTEGGDENSPAAADTDADASAPSLEEAGTVPVIDAQLAPQDAGMPFVADAAVSDAPFDSGTGNAAMRTSLILPEDWKLLDADEDPFEDRPAVVNCRPGGVVVETLAEERVLGVETGFCDYLTAQQFTRRAVSVGEVLKMRLWHFELSAPDPAEAHAVIRVDGLTVFDERIPIPKPGGLIVRQLRVERDIPTGAPVLFHLHNHGANSWALVEVSAGL